MADFVTIEKAAELEGVTGRAIELNAVAGKYTTRLSDQISANGKRKTLIDVHSLSIPAQIKYYKVEEKTNATPSEQLVGISESARKIALERLAIVQEAEEIRERHRNLHCSQGGADGAGAVAALKALAARHQISYQTLCRWRKDFRAKGFAGLLPKHGKERGSRLDPNILEAIQTEWLQPTKPSQWTVYEKVADWCAENLIQAPSYKAVQRVIAKIPSASAVYWRSGEKEWLSKAAPKGKRDLSDLSINDWWCSDHREFDLFVRSGDKIFRPWSTCWRDLKSHKTVGRIISPAPNSRTIAMALRQGILSHGAPNHVYVDNGKDYECHYLNGKTKRIGPIESDTDSKGVYALLNIQVHNAIPYSAWSKPIERWHRDITTFERTLPGWCGRDNKERPEKLMDEIKNGELLTLEELVILFDQWIEKSNAKINADLGCSPNDLWAEFTPKVPEERTLDLLLMEEQQRKVGPHGIKLFPGRWHYATELAMHIGSFVTVRYDINDVGRAHIFLEGGKKYLCTAVDRKLLKMGASRDDMRALAREKADARRQAREYRESRHQLSNDDTLLAGIVAAKNGKGELAPGNGKPPQPGKVVRLVVPIFDRQAKALEATPAPDLTLPSPSEQEEALDEEVMLQRYEREMEEKKNRERLQRQQEEEEQRLIFERG